MLMVKKFSWNAEEKECKVTYHIDRGEAGKDLHVLECRDKPTKELREALQALETDAVRELEVVKLDDHCVTVRSISYSWSHDIMGASVCLLVSLKNSNSPLVMNTPHKPSMAYSEGSTTPLLPVDFADALDAVHRLIEKYIDGEREEESEEQTDLFEQPVPEGFEGTTYSINGGPAVPLGTVQKLNDALKAAVV